MQEFGREFDEEFGMQFGGIKESGEARATESLRLTVQAGGPKTKKVER